MNKELQPGLLLDEKGNLNEAGFSLAPVKEYQRSQIHGLKWRIKEWDYYYIGNQDYGLCLTISDVSKSLTFLSLPDSQKEQPMLHPTWLDTHTELPCLYLISTLSTTLPSARANRYFLVASDV